MINQSLILIPARMDSTRLPHKVLADINATPMVIHVAKQARKANIGPVIIATDHPAIKNVAQEHGFVSLMTSTSHLSGSDRIYEALCAYDPEEKFQYIINLQADLPLLDSQAIIDLNTVLQKNSADIVTLGAKIIDNAEKENPNIVKIIASLQKNGTFRALYFTRAKAPYGDGPLYHHIGIYGYQRNALKQFISLAPSPLEQQEKLEQLRALENGMTINVTMIKKAPISVDTFEELEQVRAHFINNSD